MVVQEKPESLAELTELAWRSGSNPSRTLETMSRYRLSAASVPQHICQPFPHPQRISCVPGNGKLGMFPALSYMSCNEGVRMLSLRLPADIGSRLEALARKTGRTKSFYAREAILEKTEDMEDAYLGSGIVERIRKGEEEVLSSEGMWRGLDD